MVNLYQCIVIINIQIEYENCDWGLETRQPSVALLSLNYIHFCIIHVGKELIIESVHFHLEIINQFLV